MYIESYIMVLYFPIHCEVMILHIVFIWGQALWETADSGG